MSKKKETRLSQTIVYVNFAPYENTGRILDYLLERFENVLQFSFNFHRLGKKQDKSRLISYHNGKEVSTHFLVQVDVPARMIFLFLPIRSLLLFLQIFYHLLRLKHAYNNYDIYFTVNAYTAWIGMVLKTIGLVEKTVFWVWDYYPPFHANKIILFMRWLYWQFDKICTKSDGVIFLNNRLQRLRIKSGLLPKNAHFPIVPMGTHLAKQTRKKYMLKPVFVFLGVVKESQGLDLLFRSLPVLLKKYTKLEISIIGSGPEEEEYKRIVKQHNFPVRFHGYIPFEFSLKKPTRMEKILRSANIGLAPYVPEKSNVSYFGDPSKIKAFLSFGIPVVTTNVFEFSREIKTSHAGIVMKDYSINSFLAAVETCIENHFELSRNASTLAKKYNYKKIYNKLFVFTKN